MPRMRVLRRTVIALVLGVLVLEGALRALGLYLTKTFEANLKAAQETKDCVTILTLGESTTGGLYVNGHDSYPRQLERRLRLRYGRPVCTITPIHFGQNTSQMYKRFDRYMTTFKPRLVVFMCGANNTWSLEESNIGSFIDLTNPDALGLRLRLTLDRSRVFKLARMAKYDLDGWRKAAKDDLSGRAQYTPWPPPDENVEFGTRNQKAFLALWAYEVGHMIDTARSQGVPSILMTYPNYHFPPVSAFEELAAAKQIPLVRNDLMFQPLLASDAAAHKYFFPDRGHPREIGYAMMAAEVARVIEEKDLLRLEGSTASNPPR